MPSITYDPVETGVAPGALPSAQPGSFTPAVGQALQHVGEEGGRIAGDLNRINYMRDQYDQMSQVAKIAGDARVQFTKSFRDQTEQLANTDGRGFVDKFQGQIDDYFNQVQQQYNLTNPRAREMLNQHMASIKATALDNSINWEYHQGQAYRVNNFMDAKRDLVNTVYQDPTQYQSVRDLGLKNLDGVPEGLNPLALETKTRLKEQFINELTQAAGLKSAEVAPQATKNAILGVTPPPPNSVQGKIVSAVESSPEAKRAGLTPNVALAVASAENDTFDPTRKNPIPGQSAMGLFGMIDDTWKRMGGTAENRLDPDAQAQFGTKNLAANTLGLRDLLKRQPTPGEIYSTQWGTSFAGVLAKVPATMPATQVFAQAGYKDPQEAASLNHVDNMTAGQLRQHFDTMMAQHMSKTQGMANQPDQPQAQPDNDQDHPWIKDASPELRQAILTHAEAQLHKDDSLVRATAESQVKNFMSAMSYGDNAPRPSLEILTQAFGPRALAVNQELDSMQRYGSTYARMKILPTSQFQNLVDSLKPDDLSASATDRQNYAAIQGVAQNIAEQRKAQPLEMAAASGAYNVPPLDLANQETLPAQLKIRAEAASQISKDYGTALTIMTREEAAKMSAYIGGATTGQVSDMIGKLRTGLPDARSYMAALGQIAPNQTVPAVVGAIMAKQNPMTFPGGFFSPAETAKQGDVAMTMLDGWRALNPADKKEGKELAIPPDAEFRAEFAAKVGNTFGTDAQSYTAAFEAAKAYYVGAAMKSGGISKDWTHDAQAQFDRGIQAATGGITNYNGRGKIALPWGMPGDSFNNAMSQRIPQAITQSGLDPKDYPASSQQLMTIGDGRYRLVNGTSPVIDKQGRFVDIDLLNHPAALPSPALSMQDIDIGRKMFAPADKRSRR